MDDPLDHNCFVVLASGTSGRAEYSHLDAHEFEGTQSILCRTYTDHARGNRSGQMAITLVNGTSTCPTYRALNRSVLASLPREYAHLIITWSVSRRTPSTSRRAPAIPPTIEVK
jgi:hypothetical protein